mgnify:FL=1
MNDNGNCNEKGPKYSFTGIDKNIALVVCLEDVVNDNDSAGGEVNSYSSSSTSNGGRDDGALIIIEHCTYVVV